MKGDAAMRVLSGHAGTLDEAVAMLQHINFGTKDEMREAIAYLSCQVSAYRRIANEDAALAIQQIKTITDAYSMRRTGQVLDERKTND